MLVECRPHGVAAEGAVVADGHADDLDVHDAGRRRDRRVRLDAADDPPAVRPRGAGGLEPVARGLAGGNERREVPERPALHEHATGAGRQSELGGEPAQHLVLGVHGAGALEPRAAVERARRHDEVERRCGLRGRAGDERQVAGIVGRDAGGREDVLEDAERLRGADAALVDRASREAGELRRWQRLVERCVLREQSRTRVVEDEVHDRAGLVGDVVHARVVRTGHRSSPSGIVEVVVPPPSAGVRGGGCRRTPSASNAAPSASRAVSS